MQITIGITADDPRTLRKTIKDTVQVSAEIKDDVNILNPDFYIKNSSAIIQNRYNYLQAWGRYYFITGMTVITGQGLRISCRQDVLMTYADQIAACPAIISRNSALPNTYIADGQIRTEAYQLQQVLTFNDFTYFNQAIIVCVG